MFKQKTAKYIDFFKKLGVILSKKDKTFLLLLLFFSIFIALIETFAISILMPFIAVSTNFNLIKTNKYFNFFYHLFSFSSQVYFVATFGILLIVFYLLRGAINIFYYYLLAKFSVGRYHNIAYRLFSSYMSMSYADFINSNTSELSKTIITEAYNLTVLILSFVLMMSEVCVALFIYSVLLYVNWEMTILLTLFLSLNVVFLLNTVSKQIKSSGKERERFQKKFYKVMNSSFGNFKIIKLKSKSADLLKNFFDSSLGFTKANIKNQGLSFVPRYFLETIGFGLISFFVVYSVLHTQTDIRNALPIISIFILGLYRLLPSANRLLTNYNLIIFLQSSLDIVYNNIEYETENLGNEKIGFSDKIVLEGLSFGYLKNKPVLRDISLTIHKGEKIAITGETGCGKSTLIDLIIGLFKPDGGGILVDDVQLSEKNIKSWRKKIGYIPQSIYLFDGTVAQNVAIEEEITDEEKIKKALRKVNILEFFEKHHQGIYTKVGEGGIKLSGGQKQRVAIARALYDDPEILVLDEATSSLDNETEALIMDEIYEFGRDKTLIIVAHRLSTIERCERIYDMADGYIKETSNVV